MRLGQALSNFGNRLKTFGLKAGSTLSHVAPKIVKFGSVISGGLSHMPGIIGTAAGYVHKGLDAANKLINSLPESKFKDKLQSLSNNANNAVNTIQPKITNAAKTAQVVGDTAGKIINAVNQKII